MANSYISTLKDSDGNQMLPRTAMDAVVDLKEDGSATPLKQFLNDNFVDKPTMDEALENLSDSIDAVSGRVDNKSNATNLENGEGQYSLVQNVAPSTDPSLHPENEAAGKEAVALGRYDIASGDRSMTVNYDNKNYGKWSFVANTKNKNGNENSDQTLIQSNAMFGSGNEIKVGMEGLMAGKANTNYEGNRFDISGSENENYTNNVRITGWKNKSLKEIKTPITSGGGGGTTPPDTPPTEPTEPYDYTGDTGYADISGTQNEVFAMGGKTSGVAGICYSPFGSTEGFWTKAGYLVEDTTKSTETERYYKPQGLGAKAFGRATHAKEDFTLAGGDHSEALKKGSNAIGYYAKANTEWGTAIGKFNVGYTNALFEIGAGTNTSNRKNALTVYEDGRIVNINGGELITGVKTGWAHEGSADAGKLMVLDSTGNFLVTNVPTLSSHLTNKKYVDDNKVQKETKTGYRVYVHTPFGDETVLYSQSAVAGDIPQRTTNGNIEGPDVSKINYSKYYTTKEYVEKHFSQATNLENGAGTDSIVQKYSGTIDATHFGNTNTGESATVLGEANSNTANRALMAGKMNRSNAPNSIIAGLGNGRGIGATPDIAEVISGQNVIIGGFDNRNINANNSIVTGVYNKNEKQDSVLGGYANTNKGQGSILVGKNLWNENDYCAVFGQWNKVIPNARLIVGRGIDGQNRYNAFEVYQDGHAEVGVQGQTDNSVVQKQYVDSMFLKVYTTEIVATNVPSVYAPKLTAEQVANIQTAISQGKQVWVDASYGGLTHQFNLLESDHDGSTGGIRFTYYNNYLNYVLENDVVTVTCTAIGGGSSGGTKLYRHSMFCSNNDVHINVLSTRSSSYDKTSFVNDMLAGNCIFTSGYHAISSRVIAYVVIFTDSYLGTALQVAIAFDGSDTIQVEADDLSSITDAVTEL